MVLGLIVPADSAMPVQPAQLHQLSDYQEVVGGLIEPVDLAKLELSIYVNEEGLIHGLPFNERTTSLSWAFEPQLRYRALLVGDALIVGLPDSEGQSTDVPDTMLTHLLRWLR